MRFYTRDVRFKKLRILSYGHYHCYNESVRQSSGPIRWFMNPLASVLIQKISLDATEPIALIIFEYNFSKTNSEYQVNSEESIC